MVSRAAWFYIGLVVLATAALVNSTPYPAGYLQDQHYWRDLIILQLLFLICDSTPAPLVSRQTKWSPSSAATLAAVVLLGPLAAALVGAVSVVSVKRQLRLDGRLFNGAMGALSGLLAGETYLYLYDKALWPEYGLTPQQLTLHPVPLGQVLSTNPWLVIGPFAAAAAVHVLIN